MEADSMRQKEAAEVAKRAYELVAKKLVVLLMCFKALLDALYNYVYCSFEDKADVA